MIELFFFSKLLLKFILLLVPSTCQKLSLPIKYILTVFLKSTVVEFDILQHFFSETVRKVLGFVYFLPKC